MPGGRLEPGEDPATCLAREVAEELGADVAVEAILDSWVYEALPQREVLIVTYGVRRSNQRAIRISDEHAGENVDLFWGIGGAGANFGVVMQFEYRLHSVGPVVAGW